MLTVPATSGTGPSGTRSAHSVDPPPRLAMMPEPRWPKCPASTHSPRMARHDEPPLRLRSGPQPMRSRAGRAEATSSASSSILTPPRRTRPRPRRPATRGGGQVLLDPARVGGAELLVHHAPLLQQAGHGVGEHDIGARAHGEVQVGAVGHAGPARIDDHQPGAVALGLGQERQEVGVRDGRVGAPDDDEAADRDVQRIGREHVAEGVVPAWPASPRRWCGRPRAPPAVRTAAG